MDATNDATVTPVERQRRLMQAARDYVAGRITSDEYRARRDRYMTDFLAAAVALVRARRRPKRGNSSVTRRAGYMCRAHSVAYCLVPAECAKTASGRGILGQDNTNGTARIGLESPRDNGIMCRPVSRSRIPMRISRGCD